MSLNKTPELQLFQGELTVQHHKDVEISFKKIKYSCEHLKGTKVGHLYLTNFRLFFVNDKKNDMLQNMSMPFKLMKDFEIKQPVFGANYLEGKIQAEHGGGWQGSAEFHITFRAGGAVEVGSQLVKLAKNPRMMYVAQPTIIMAGVSPPQTVYSPPPASYNPVAPPGYSVMSPQQPPYQQNGAYPQQPEPCAPTDSKAQEAMVSNLPPGYSAPFRNPPSYDALKKEQ